MNFARSRRQRGHENVHDLDRCRRQALLVSSVGAPRDAIPGFHDVDASEVRRACTQGSHDRDICKSCLK